MKEQEIRFSVTGKRSGGNGDPWKHEVTGLLLRPGDASHMFVMGHGAGAGIRHSFMQAVAEGLSRHGVATFRYQFPYMENGRKRPDHHSVLTKTVSAAVVSAFGLASDLPIVAGGKSMGGRMASRAASMRELPNLMGLVFLGFPLHPLGKPGVERAGHLSEVRPPMLFVQGTRDKLATAELLSEVTVSLRNAVVHWVEGADHSFKVLKRSGRTDTDVLAEITETTATWIKAL